MDLFQPFSASSSAPGRIRVIFLVLFFFAAFCTACAGADTWQPAEVRSWVQADTPPGWSVSLEQNGTEKPDSSLIVATSPDLKTRLRYILEHTGDTMTESDVQQFQSGYMSKMGFRICMTKDPIREKAADHTSFRQTYVRGSEDAAVIGTLVYPDWGIAHFVLIMEGPDAVAKYYESIPPLVAEHIRPVSGGKT